MMSFIHELLMLFLSDDKFAGFAEWFDYCFITGMTQDDFHISLIALTDNQLLDAYSTTVTGVVKNVASAVVHIRVTKNSESPQATGMNEQSAFGSGFVISTDGYIVTNNHVVEGKNNIIVTFSDGIE